MSALPFLGGKLRVLRLSAHRPRLRLHTSGAVRSTEDAAGKPPHRPEPHDPRAMSRWTAAGAKAGRPREKVLSWQPPPGWTRWQPRSSTIIEKAPAAVTSTDLKCVGKGQSV